MSAWEKDLLGRAEVASFLQNLLESDDDIKVINIDSPWGTGKTFFLEAWKDELKNDRGVVYFNAWEKDYTGDPFVSLVSVIKDQLEEQVGSSKPQNEIVEKFKEKAQETFFATAPTAFKYVSKALLKKATGVDADELDDEISGILSQASDVALRSVIDDFKNSEKVIEDFEVTFTALVEAVAEKKSGNSKGPVYVLIDELDRCRPTYAIELLERVKHFFNVPGCKFVIATDTSQLQHSIKAIYGSGFDSVEYLKRFFDLDYSLDNSNITDWVKAKLKCDAPLYCLDLETKKPGNNYYSRFGVDPIVPDADTVWGEGLNEKQAIIIALSKTFNCSLRTIDRILKHLEASLINIKEPSVHYFYLAYLIFLKNKDADLYYQFISYSSEDEKNILEEICKKYKPMKLYFVYSSVHVHQIASDYFRFKNMSKQELRKSEESDCPYIEKIKEDLWGKKSTLNYEGVVNLASKIGVDKR